MNHISIYIHIPYCLKKCLYCNFNSIEITPHSDILKAYLKALNEEIKRSPFSIIPASQLVVNSIFFGGGTPTILNPQDLGSILDTIKKYFTIADKAEITVEANPETLLNKYRLDTLKREGINRISLGVQTFEDLLLKVLGRVHNRDTVLQAVDNIKSAGFKNFSIDLIYGIPFQGFSQWENTIYKAIYLSPLHISAYNLTLEEGTPLYNAYVKKDVILPSEELQVSLYKHGKDILTAHGYRHYEISNFAKEGAESRHNLNYWDHGEYIGFGAGAHSYYNGKRWWNIENPVTYISAVRENSDIISGIEDITRQDAIKEYIMLGLRKINGIDNSEFKRRFQIDILTGYKDILNNLLAEGLIYIYGNKICLSEKGILFHNEVASRFF